MKSPWIACACLFLASACAAGDADPPTVDGATPEEAADIVIDVTCAKTAECGYISASCTPCSIDEPDCEIVCTVEHRPVTEAECISDAQEELEQGIGCEELTSEEIALIDECLAAVPSARCPSVEEVEAWVDGGREGRDPREPIEACDLLRDDIRYRCSGGE